MSRVPGNPTEQKLRERAEFMRDAGHNDDADLDIEAAIALTTLERELEEARTDRDKFQAIAEDKLADTRLLSAGPRDEGGFGFDLMGGPIPYIAEYLFQFIGAREEKGPSNYAEIEVQHNTFGAMTLTLQRRSGQTPHQLKAAAEAALTASQEEVERLKALVETAFRDGLSYASIIQGDPDLAWERSKVRAALHVEESKE